jgi:UPF0271 protein
MPERVIDINADIGEGFGHWKLGDDSALTSLITTANVACGFHAGDPLAMKHAVGLAKDRGVVVGAHTGTPDLLGFGRRVMQITPEEAYAYTVYQVGALREFLHAAGMDLHHVKPHGAMYPMLRDAELAEGVAEAIDDVMVEPVLYWPAPWAATALPEAAQRRGIRVVLELYPDAHYTSEGELSEGRSFSDTDPELISGKVRTFLEEGSVLAMDGTTKIAIDAESICVDGDGGDAVEIARAVRTAVERAGVEVRPLSSAELSR